MWIHTNFGSDFIENADCQKFDTKFDVNFFKTEPSATNMKFPFEISMNKVKLVVIENHQFECRLESKTLALYADFSDYADSDASTKINRFFRTVCRKWEGSNCELDGRN